MAISIGAMRIQECQICTRVGAILRNGHMGSRGMDTCDREERTHGIARDGHMGS